MFTCRIARPVVMMLCFNADVCNEYHFFGPMRQKAMLKGRVASLTRRRGWCAARLLLLGECLVPESDVSRIAAI